MSDYLTQAEPEQPKPLNVEEWTILCPGPSLADWDPSEALDGPIIAVNEAIGLIDDADVWGLTKIPLHIDPILADYGLSVNQVQKTDQRIWANSGLTENYLIGRCDRTYPNRQPALEKFTGFPHRCEWTQAPWLGFAAVAITMGAKRILVVGADMRGHGYAGIPDGPFGYREEADYEDGRRWRLEHRIVEMAVGDAKLAGIEIEVVGMSERERTRKSVKVEPVPVMAQVDDDDEEDDA